MSDSVKRYLINILNCQVKALKKYQSPTGMWHTLIDEETSYEETSATAGFAFGILKAVHMGIISKDYEVCGKKAIEALISKVDDDGSVTDVSTGTPMGNDKEFYRNIEKYNNLLYMDILIVPEFQRIGIGSKVIRDIQNDIFEFGYQKIKISIDEKNIASIKLFEKSNFKALSKEDELIHYIYEKSNE